MAVEDYKKLLKRAEKYARDNSKALAKAESSCSKSRILAKMAVQLSSDNIVNVVKLEFITNGLWDQWTSKADQIIELQEKIEELKKMEKDVVSLDKEVTPIGRKISANIDELEVIGKNMMENGKILKEMMKKL